MYVSIVDLRVEKNTEKPVSARFKVNTRSTRDGTFLPEMGRSYAPSRDGTFLRAEPRWDVLARRTEMGRFYAPNRDGTFLRAELRSWDVLTRLTEIMGRS